MKVALCIPAYDRIHAKFVQCLADMIEYSKTAILERDGERLEVEMETLIVSSSILTESRHRLVAEALTADADYIMFMDADHVFPRDAFCRLWAHNLPVVGVNYSRRCTPTAPTAAKIVTDDADKDHKNLIYTTEGKAMKGEVEEVSHMGLGLVLIDARVFTALQAHAEKNGEETMLPLFEFVRNPNGHGVIGEDVFFFNKLKDAGFVPFLDHGLSWEVGHLSEAIMTCAHANQQKEGWLEREKKTRAKFENKAVELESNGD